MKTKILSLTVIGSLALLSTLRAENAADTTFAKQAAVAGMTEVKAGQLASDRGGTPEIKDFGAMMVTDHTKANDQLKAIATEQKIELPSKPDARHQMMLEKLTAAKGRSFDKMYIDAMVEGHEKVLALFKTEDETTQDAKLKSFVEETIPVIQMHLEKAKSIQASLK